MRTRLSLGVVAFALGATISAALVFRATRPKHEQAPDVVWVERARQVAKLQVYEVSVFRKIQFQPEPKTSESSWADLANWLRELAFPQRGKAIVFADVRFFADVQKLDVRVRGSGAEIVLPPIQAEAHVRPGETEIIDSNLNSEQTAKLLEQAELAFLRDAHQNAAWKHRASEQLELALRALFLQAGLTPKFVSAVAAPGS